MSMIPTCILAELDTMLANRSYYMRGDPNPLPDASETGFTCGVRDADGFTLVPGEPGWRPLYDNPQFIPAPFLETGPGYAPRIPNPDYVPPGSSTDQARPAGSSTDQAPPTGAYEAPQTGADEAPQTDARGQKRSTARVAKPEASETLDMQKGVTPSGAQKQGGGAWAQWGPMEPYKNPNCSPYTSCTKVSNGNCDARARTSRTPRTRLRESWGGDLNGFISPGECWGPVWGLIHVGPCGALGPIGRGRICLV